MSAPVTLREAGLGDLADALSLLAILYKGDVGPNLKDLMREFISARDHLVLLALRDDARVGLLVGSYRLDIDYECRAGLVDAIVVEPSQRSQGIGWSLLRQFAAWARHRGCTKLQVLNPNRDFFRKAGFADRDLLFQHVSIDKIET